MADHDQQVDFIPVKDTDILAERTRMYDRVNQATVICIAAIAAILVLMAIFLV